MMETYILIHTYICLACRHMFINTVTCMYLHTHNYTQLHNYTITHTHAVHFHGSATDRFPSPTANKWTLSIRTLPDTWKRRRAHTHTHTHTHTQTHSHTHSPHCVTASFPLCVRLHNNGPFSAAVTAARQSPSQSRPIGPEASGRGERETERGREIERGTGTGRERGREREREEVGQGEREGERKWDRNERERE